MTASKSILKLYTHCSDHCLHGEIFVGKAQPSQSNWPQQIKPFIHLLVWIITYLVINM